MHDDFFVFRTRLAFCRKCRHVSCKVTVERFFLFRHGTDKKVFPYTFISPVEIAAARGAAWRLSVEGSLHIVLAHLVLNPIEMCTNSNIIMLLFRVIIFRF